MTKVVPDILPLRIILLHPPPDVTFALRSGQTDLIPPSRKTKSEITFGLSVRLATRPDGAPNFLGPFTYGTPAARYLGITSGTLASQADSCWTRAAKIPLAGITWPMIRKALKTSGAVLAVSVPGAMKDGGPVCATVRLLDKGWIVVTQD